MVRGLLTTSVLMMLTAAMPARATVFAQGGGKEIGFLETFALAEDREAALKVLVPGTEQYYYFHCLHYQNELRLDQVDELLKRWQKRLGKSRQHRQMQNRQAMLRYSDNPKETLEYLKDRLNLDFNHQREIPDAQKDLPSKLNPKLLATDKLLKQALRQNENTDGFRDAGLRLLANHKLNRSQRRHLLSRLRHPDFPNLVELVAEDLRDKDSRGFGSLKIHFAMTLAQLDKLAKRRHDVKTSKAFVQTYIKKLHPSDDTDWQNDQDEYRAYLKRLWNFVEPLPPAFNSLKANVLYHQLDFDRRRLEYHSTLFQKYLKLPRRASYCHPKFLDSIKSSRHIVSMDADFSNQSSLAPIGDDRELIEEYLRYVTFWDASGGQWLRPYFNESFFERNAAIGSILKGVEKEQLTSKLPPTEYKELVERVDINFLPTNLEIFAINDEVSLELYLKNVPSLIVKVFEINTRNYYRKYQREIDTDINLDGLVPNFEEIYEYDEAPAKRVKRRFQFPQLKKRGVYVVDFIAGGKSSRALIRKGQLTMTSRVTAAGKQLTIIDQAGAVVEGAIALIGGTRYEADHNGRILIPFSTQPGPAKAIICHGDFCCLQNFQQMEETYKFHAAMVVDREQLTRSNQAKVLIRPSLTVAGVPATVRLLERSKLTVTATNLDGIVTNRSFDNLKLASGQETVCDFVVPPRLKDLRFDLSVQVRNVSKAEDQTLTSSETYSVNKIDQSTSIQDVHLVPAMRGYFLEVLGKTGETRPGQAVRVGLVMNQFTRNLFVDLKSDENGLIELGWLTNVQSIEVILAGDVKKKWQLKSPRQTYPRSIHCLRHEVIDLPVPQGVDSLAREHFSLLELRNSSYVADRFGHLAIKDGRLTVSKLEPGDYELTLRSAHSFGPNYKHSVRVRVTDGRLAGNVLIGKHRHLESRGKQKLHVVAIAADKKQIKIRLGNADASARVHIIADRYFPAFNSWRSLSNVRDIDPWKRNVGTRRSRYVQGRKIGDEYEYILRRKLANKFPGNMLQRPSLLLNPWSTRKTSNDSQMAQVGDEFSRAGSDTDGKSERDRTKKAEASSKHDFSNLNFLGESAVVLANLEPDENGDVTIKRKRLGPNQHIRIFALDTFQTIERSINLPLRKINPQDARLTHSLDRRKHYAQSKQTKFLKKGETLTIDDIVSARFQYYDDLGDIFRLFLTLNNRTHLSKFEFLLTWEDQDESKQRKLYSKFACHELNFFLWKKDRKFFDNVVAPHLRNKRTRTFMDQWLLNEDLSKFTAPWKFAQLNAFERILLAQRTPDRTSDIALHIAELYETKPTTRKRFDGLYDFAIGQSGLEERSREMYLGRAKAKEGISGTKSPLPRFRGGGVGGAMVKRDNRFDNANGLMFDDADDAMALEPGSKRLGDEVYRFDSMGGRKPADHSGKELRLHAVPAPEVRKEIRKRKLSDGSVESYAVMVPNSEEALEYYDAPVAGQELGLEFNDRLIKERERGRKLYHRLKPTREWVENNYYLLPLDQQSPQLVQVNQFWQDYSQHEGGPFLSQFFVEAHRTFTEMMFAMAVLDLPLTSVDAKISYADTSMTCTASGPTIAFHQQVRDAELSKQPTKIFVSENFYLHKDRYTKQNGQQLDKFVFDNFLAHALYGGQVVITNPTSTPRAIELLVQIPEGAVPAHGSQETRTIQLHLDAFSTKTFEYAFYFPTAGEFNHYPAHVSAKGEVIALVKPQAFQVIDQPKELDRTSWAFVSQNGSDEEVLDFLTNNNIRSLDLKKIAFRMKDKSFFGKAIELLNKRCVYNHALWAYAVRHGDEAAIKEFLRHAKSFAGELGIAFESDLISINPVERKWYQHREYWPLINARTHQLGAKRRILNPSFYRQYTTLLSILANRSRLTDDDHLVVTCYMLLQDRIESAVSHFDQVSPDQLLHKMQYDYCDAYLDIYRSAPESAATKAKKWLDHPVEHWRSRFEAIVALAEEIARADVKATEGSGEAQQQAKLASEAPSFDFEIKSGVANIQYQNIDSLLANFYEMDIELLFSRSPFADNDRDGFSLIRPNLMQTINLSKSKLGNESGQHELKLPESLQNKNVLVEIVAGNQTKSQAFFAHSLNVQIQDKFGQLQVTHQQTGKALPTTYVKVYARMQDGSVRFHKDGYTDLRGRFDYVSQSNRLLDGIQKFSILILNEDNGAIIRKADVPLE